MNSKPAEADELSPEYLDSISGIFNHNDWQTIEDSGL
jgi:hypothetical protein